MLRRLACLVLLGVLPLARPAHAAREPWGEVVLAVEQMTRGELEPAVESLARARKINPHPELDALVGLAALQGGEPRLAVHELESAITKGSAEPLVFYWAARAHLIAGAAGPALRRLRQGLAIADEPSFHMAHALLLRGAGQDAAAGEALSAAARGQPLLASPSLFPPPVEGAVQLMGRLLRRFPARLQVLRTEGHLLWQAHRIHASCVRFQQILDQQSGDSDALAMLARCEAAMGRTEQALKLAERALVRAPGSPQALAARGEILLELGQSRRAVQDLQKAVDGLPRDARLLAQLARACTDAEQPACAHKFFTYALRRQPSLAAAAFGLALQLQQQGKLDQAEASFRLALKGIPEARYYRAAASLAHQRGHRKQARAWLAEAARADRVRRAFEGVSKPMARLTSRLRELELASTPCGEPCRKLSWRLPSVMRDYLQLHLATKAGQTGRAKRLAGQILPNLTARRLLLENPVVYEIKWRTVDGRTYVLRMAFPFVPSFRLQSNHTK